MKVLHVVNVYPDRDNPSAQPFVKAQVDSLKGAAIEVDVLNVRGNESRFNYVKAIGRCRKKVREGGYDVVHGHYVYSGLIAALQDRAVRVVSFMGSDLYGTFNDSGRITVQGRFDIALSKMLQFMVDGIIVKSPEMMELLTARKKTVVLPNGVDFNVFKKRSKAEAKQMLGLRDKKKYVLFAGDYLSPRKGYAVLEDAVSLLKQSYPEYEMLLANKVPHESVPLYMSAAEVLALPSLKEGSPNVVKEAIACDLPVVATDVGDIREIIGSIPGCYLVDRTASAFAKAIDLAAGSNRPFNGRSHIEHLRMEHIAKRLVAFYERLVSGKGAGAVSSCAA